ncbi:hypothetical protein AB0L63_18785 [Nocardia sp. NPDC051990]|uniref:hypothetical protein n=1 Tax=Nocardia sp. NPDC051990 TaxID=3155285 RepID=UPI00342DFA17
MPIVGGPQSTKEPNESKANAPALTPKLWYGMPAYAKDGKVVCFFRTGELFESRHATFGSNDIATPRRRHHIADRLCLKLTANDEERLGALVRMAVG